MQFITAEQVKKICEYSQLVAAFEKFHNEPPADLKDMLLSSYQDNVAAPNHLLVRAAWHHGKALGLKAATVFPANAVTKNLPNIHAVYVLFDGYTGEPSLIIDGTSMTYYKTAADSALGAKLLARKDIKKMAMIGAGAMAPHLIKAHCSMYPSIEEVVIWNRTFTKAKSLADELKIDNVAIRACNNIQSTVEDSELISSATMTIDPIIFGEWISPGTHLDLVGAFTPNMREVDDEAIKKSKIFVDSRNTTIGEIGEITIPLETGLIQESDIRADLYELCTQCCDGRTSNVEITLFKNGGGGHLDLMTAQFIFSRLTQSSQ